MKTGSWVRVAGCKSAAKRICSSSSTTCVAVCLPTGHAIRRRRICSRRLTPRAVIRCAIVQQAFAALLECSSHLQIGNAVPEDMCTDSPLCRAVPVPGPAGSHRLEERPGNLKAVAAQFRVLRDRRRLHPAFLMARRTAITTFCSGTLLRDSGLEHALRDIGVDTGAQTAVNHHRHRRPRHRDQRLSNPHHACAAVLETRA